MQASAPAIPLEMKAEGGLETRGTKWGDLSVRHVRLPAGADFTPLFEGLPGDLCQCPHWGYVVEGSIHIRYSDGTEELSRAGDLYHWPGGHTGWTTEPVVFVEFSPAEELAPVLEHLATKMTQAPA